jgi:CheY-like chemotaxis protein
MSVHRPHILSVSYDSSLLKTRELILNGRGYRVTSALGWEEALKHCEKAEKFDAFVLGHSIPHLEKETLIERFRANCRGRVVALKRVNEQLVRGADVEVEPEPDKLISTLSMLVSGESPNETG